MQWKKPTGCFFFFLTKELLALCWHSRLSGGAHFLFLNSREIEVSKQKKSAIETKKKQEFGEWIKPTAYMLLSLPRENFTSLSVSFWPPLCHWTVWHSNWLTNCQRFSLFCGISFICCVSHKTWPHEWRRHPSTTHHLPHFPHLGEGRGCGREWRGGQE